MDLNEYTITDIIDIRDKLISLKAGSWVFFDIDNVIVSDDGAIIQSEILTLIDDLKSSGIYIFGLTRRYAGGGNRFINFTSRIETLTELQLLRVEFSELFPYPDYHLERSVLILMNDNLRPVIFDAGIAFTSDSDKGLALLKLLKRAIKFNIPLPPEIAFLDDLKYNIDNVQSALQTHPEYHINFIGIHYIHVQHLNDLSI